MGRHTTEKYVEMIDGIMSGSVTKVTRRDAEVILHRLGFHRLHEHHDERPAKHHGMKHPPIKQSPNNARLTEFGVLRAHVEEGVNTDDTRKANAACDYFEHADLPNYRLTLHRNEHLSGRNLNGLQKILIELSIKSPQRFERLNHILEPDDKDAEHGIDFGPQVCWQAIVPVPASASHGHFEGSVNGNEKVHTNGNGNGHAGTAGNIVSTYWQDAVSGDDKKAPPKGTLIPNLG